jgi:methylenetetrahydrofolate reductase (NADPH)
MSLKEAIKSNKFIITAEIAPPKGVDIEALLESAEILRGVVDAINVTDNQRAVMRLSSLSFCAKLVQKGFDPILQMVCRDKNALALQSDILGAYVLGIRNILALSGDYPNHSDQPGVKPVFDLDSVQLVDLIKKLDSGVDLAGNKLTGKPFFTIGAVVNPGADPLEPQIIKLNKKMEAGAEFIQTQVVYDVEKFKKFLKEAKISPKVKVIAGIFPLRSYRMATFVNENVPGVSVPEKILKRIENAKDPLKEGLDISVDLIQELKPLCSGIHLMTLNNLQDIPEIIKRVGLI